VKAEVDNQGGTPSFTVYFEQSGVGSVVGLLQARQIRGHQTALV